MSRAGAHRVFRQPWGRRAVLRGAGLSSRGLSTPAAQQQPQAVFSASRQPRMVCTHTHMHFTGGYLGNPASLPASLATLCTRACP